MTDPDEIDLNVDYGPFDEDDWNPQQDEDSLDDEIDWD
jgi:hypothetical protein